MKISRIFCICLSFLGASYANSKVCNPFKCFFLMSSFFQISGISDEDACLKINKMQKCVLDCSFERNESNHLMRGFAAVEHEICKDMDFSTNLYKNAKKYQGYLDAHKFSLLMCFYEKFNQIAVGPKFDRKLFTCSMLDATQHCPSSSTFMQHVATDAVETLTTLFLKPWREEYCELFSIKDIKEFEMTSLPDSKDYYKLGKCLDENNNRTMSCIPEKWTSTNVVTSLQFNRKLCDAVEIFVGCVANVIRTHCSDIPEMFSRLQRLLLSQHFFPQCSAEESSTGVAGPLAGTVDASAENASELEMVHVYQQIKIVELHHHHHHLSCASGASCCWRVLASLLVLKIFF